MSSPVGEGVNEILNDSVVDGLDESPLTPPPASTGVVLGDVIAKAMRRPEPRGDLWEEL